jgi:ABC-type dipeptide/oligopeptide/nickel transport system permease subunit
MRASRLWLSPAILVLLTIVLIASTAEQSSPAATAIAVIVGLVLGLPFGLLRGRHTDVRKTEDPQVLLVAPSIVPLVIWLVAYGARFALRAFLPEAGVTAQAASEGLLAFAVGSVISARYVIAKFRELHAA